MVLRIVVGQDKPGKGEYEDLACSPAAIPAVDLDGKTEEERRRKTTWMSDDCQRQVPVVIGVVDQIGVGEQHMASYTDLCSH